MEKSAWIVNEKHYFMPLVLLAGVLCFSDLHCPQKFSEKIELLAHIFNNTLW
jgi:hypothetical protein